MENKQIHVVHGKSLKVRSKYYLGTVRKKFPQNDYSKTKFIAVRKPITFTCPIHGEVVQRADFHRKYGCKLCLFEAKRR